MAALPQGLVVATQSYGDADPSSGFVEVFLIDRYDTTARFDSPIVLRSCRRYALRKGGTPTTCPSRLERSAKSQSWT